MMSNPDQDFWRGRRVLVTGHTGFKGAWLSAWLEVMGAEVHGFALAPEPGANLFRDLGAWKYLTSMIGDIRDRDAVEIACAAADPHLGRLLLTLRAAGAMPAEAERQALRIQPDADLPRGLADVGTREAAQWLADVQR